MIVVSDTTPIRHLIAIGEADLLHQLFGVVVIPMTVLRELHAEATPQTVKSWIERLPGWLQVRDVRSRRLQDDEHSLDPGEIDAIEIALELHPDLVLPDERHGREFALRLKLPVIGTLGVLERADVRGLVLDFPHTPAELEASGFYLSKRLRSALLERHRLRKRTTP